MRALLENEMRRQAMEASKHVAHKRLGIVSSYDPNRYAVKVTLQPEGVETGWIPLRSQWSGNGWGLFSPPINGAQVEVDFEKGDVEAGLGGGGIFSDVDRPLPVPQGECWLVHQSGLFIKLTNNNGLQLGDGQGATLSMANGQITSAGTWVHTGEFTIDGQVNLGGANPPEPVMLSNSQPATMVKAL